MTLKRWIRSTGRRWLPLLLAAASLGALAGCGGEERLSREEFGDRLQSIKQRESARFERLAQRVMRLEPNQPLPDDVKQAMRDVAGGNRRAAGELDELKPPEDAEEETRSLIEALRERADGFEQAARKEQITLRELEEEPTITRAGERIDRAFERLGKEGFLPEE
jgi:hypothetical protein